MATTRQQDRMVRRISAAKDFLSELGAPGVPVGPKFQALEGWEFLGTRQIMGLETDCWVKPWKFPLGSSLAMRWGHGMESVSAIRSVDASTSLDTWAVVLTVALKAGRVDPGEVFGDTAEWERRQLWAAEKWRGFSIPGNSETRWDPEVHGREMSEDDHGGELASVDWKPGVYSFSVGCAASVDFHQPGEWGSVPAREPSQVLLESIHQFLGPYMREG